MDGELQVPVASGRDCVALCEFGDESALLCAARAGAVSGRLSLALCDAGAGDASGGAVGAPSRACAGLAQVDRRLAASGRVLLALCDSGAQHASGVAPSPFCAGLAEAHSACLRQLRLASRHPFGRP